jgi:hypothetical protein
MMFELFLRFSPLLAMASVVCTNHFIQHRRERLRVGREASRLARLLAVELASLVEHYRDILALLTGPNKTVLPLRGSGTVFRTNAARLTALLDETMLVPLVACHAHHERIESFMQACMKPNSGFSLRPDVEAAYVEQLYERLTAGCKLAEDAIAALARCDPGAEARQAAWLGKASRVDADSVAALSLTARQPAV